MPNSKSCHPGRALGSALRAVRAQAQREPGPMYPCLTAGIHGSGVRSPPLRAALRPGWQCEFL